MSKPLDAGASAKLYLSHLSCSCAILTKYLAHSLLVMTFLHEKWSIILVILLDYIQVMISLFKDYYVYIFQEVPTGPVKSLNEKRYDGLCVCCEFYDSHVFFLISGLVTMVLLRAWQYWTCRCTIITNSTQWMLQLLWGLGILVKMLDLWKAD